MLFKFNLNFVNFNIILFVIMMWKEHKIFGLSICFIHHTFSIKHAISHYSNTIVLGRHIFVGDGHLNNYFHFLMSHRYLFPSLILNSEVEFVDRIHDTKQKILFVEIERSMYMRGRVFFACLVLSLQFCFCFYCRRIANWQV